MPPTALGIQQNVRWQRTDWASLRVGWAVMVLLLVLGVFGTFGRGGPLANHIVARQDFAIEYERFGRRETRSALHVAVMQAPRDVEVVLSEEFLRDIDVESVHPEPETVETTEAGMVMTFAARRGSGVDVYLEYRPSKTGLLPVGVSVAGETVRARTFIYP